MEPDDEGGAIGDGCDMPYGLYGASDGWVFDDEGC
jgi:hypothetical protein